MNELDKAIIELTNAKIELIQTNSKYAEIIENLDKEVNRQHKEIERLNDIINEIEKEVDRLLERQYESERFAKENGFSTYLPAKENLLCVKDKIEELKGVDKE